MNKEAFRTISRSPIVVSHSISVSLTTSHLNLFVLTLFYISNEKLLRFPGVFFLNMSSFNSRNLISKDISFAAFYSSELLSNFYLVVHCWLLSYANLILLKAVYITAVTLQCFIKYISILYELLLYCVDPFAMTTMFMHP